MNRFRIRSEEAALEALFGPSYADYRKTVRRWL
jgi:protein-S-isoprenylcysteine O-methyltransferase Ste14